MASIERRSVGGEPRWLVRYRDLDGKQRSKSFKSNREAKTFKLSIENAIKDQNYVSPQAGKTPISEWGEDWLDSVEGALKRKTMESYRCLWRSQVLPIWGNRALNSVRTSEIQAWASNMQAKGLSPSRIRQAVLLLSQMYDAAIRDRLVTRNPATMKSLKLPRLPEETEHVLLTYPEVEKLVQVLPEQDGLLVLVLAYTGIRWGEAAALRVGDLDFDTGLLTIRRSMSDVAGRLAVEAPKGHRRRVVPLPHFLTERLAEHVLGLPADSLVFRAPDGGTLRHSNWRSRRWLPAADQVGLPHTMIKSLRHLYTTTLDSGGAAYSVVRDALGHREQKTTSLYTHSTEQAREHVRQLLSGLRAPAA